MSVFLKIFLLFELKITEKVYILKVTILKLTVKQKSSMVDTNKRKRVMMKQINY